MSVVIAQPTLVQDWLFILVGVLAVCFGIGVFVGMIGWTMGGARKPKRLLIGLRIAVGISFVGTLLLILASVLLSWLIPDFVLVVVMWVLVGGVAAAFRRKYAAG